MLPLLCLCSALLLLPACDDFEGPPPIGAVRAVDPEADALMVKADAAQKAGKLGREIKALKELVEYHELAPNAAQARFRLGQAYEKDEEYRDAFKQYTKLIERYPQSPLYTGAGDVRSQRHAAHARAVGRVACGDGVLRGHRVAAHGDCQGAVQ